MKIDSEDWTIWYNLGVSYGRKGQPDLAISIYKKVIKLNPESGASYYNRAVQYLTKNEFDKACEDFHCAQRLGIDQASFAIKKSLKRHMFTHTLVKSFKCDICGTLFSEKGSMSRHMKRLHPTVSRKKEKID